MDLTSALNEMITSGLGLGLVALAYALHWVAGFVPNLFSPKTWVWKRGLEDFMKALLIGIVIVVGVGLLNVGAQFFATLGFDITEAVGDVSTYAVVGAMAFGFGYYISGAIRNAMNFFKLKSVAQGDEEKFKEGVNQIAELAKETITKMCAKQAIEGGVSADDPIKDYEDITEREEKDAGKGGIENTYAEPWRSAPQDTMVDPSSCYNRECVSYCAWKIYELTGKWLIRTGSMNAKNWVARLRENGYGMIVSAPKNGGKYIGVSTVGQYGHVIWFEEGSTISEYNYMAPGTFSVRQINLSAYTWVEIKAPGSDTTGAVKKSNQEIADEVIAGKWGDKNSNPTREQQLTAAGYDYNAIQTIVNAKLAPKTPPKETKQSKQFAVGDIVKPTKLVDYSGRALRQYDSSYTITQLIGDRAVLSSRGAVWAAMHTADIEKV